MCLAPSDALCLEPVDDPRGGRRIALPLVCQRAHRPPGLRIKTSERARVVRCEAEAGQDPASVADGGHHEVEDPPAALHWGARIPVGPVVLAFPAAIPPATVVEGIIGAGLEVGVLSGLSSA
jgi:hypothetical protein